MKRFYNMRNKAILALAGVAKKKESGSHLLEILGAIIVAVVLLILFKTNMNTIFTTALTNTNTKVQNLFN